MVLGEVSDLEARKQDAAAAPAQGRHTKDETAHLGRGAGELLKA